MSLKDILNIESKRKFNKEELSKEVLIQKIPELKKQRAYYRAYPDIFIDDISGFSEWNLKSDEEKALDPWKGFRFYYFQRITLRILMRHRKTYIVFSRGFSKSFLSMMSLMIKAVLYPNSELFITTGGKL